MENWTQDPPDFDKAYQFRWVTPEGKEVHRRVASLAYGNWEAARKRVKIERLGEGKHVELGTYRAEHILRLDEICPD